MISSGLRTGPSRWPAANGMFNRPCKLSCRTSIVSDQKVALHILVHSIHQRREPLVQAISKSPTELLDLLTPLPQSRKPSYSGSFSLPEQDQAPSLLMNPRRAKRTDHEGSNARPRSLRNKIPVASAQSNYWDSLSKVWLTPRALQELDRRKRTRQPADVIPPSPEVSCTDPVRFSRRGNPDLSYLRGVGVPIALCG